MTTDRRMLFILLALDCAATVIVFNIVGNIRGITGHFILAPLMAPIFALALSIYLIDGYRARTDMLSLDYASLHVIAVIAGMLALLLLTFVFLPVGYELQSSRAVIAFSFLALVPLTLGYRRMVYLQIAVNPVERSFIFMGDRASFDLFCEESRKMEMRQPIIFVAAGADPHHALEPGVPSPRSFGEVIADVRAGRMAVEAIVLRESNRDLPPDASESLIQLYFGGIPTYTLELFYQVYWRKIPLYRLNQTWLFQEGFQIAREPVFARLKRASDLVLSAAGLVLSAPLIALAGLAIWLDDRGPIFFVQTRVGKNHAPFRLMKLRTMRPGNGELYTLPGDTRITRVGRFLRAARLDELPQLWNVFRGEMSLIGPRAEWDRLVRDYERQIHCYYFRHLVKPGITGWAQVNYPYGSSIEDTIRKLEYDLYYIRRFSFTLDASILLKTIQIMLFGKGR